MNILLDTITDSSWNISEEEKKKGSQILEDIFSSQKDFETYFSSQAISGSIVEEIAEVDAKITLVEKDIRKVLIDNKDEVVKDLLGNNTMGKLNEFHKQLDLLWEVKNGPEKEDSINTTNINLPSNIITQQENDLLLDDILNETVDSDKRHIDNDKLKEQEDEFHIAIKKLRDRINKNKDDVIIGKGTLTSVLDNITEITELMELPFLARTCIKTGHYQEAVLLYTHTKSLMVKFHGSSIVEGICNNVLNEITTTMLNGLVKLLSTNISINSLKKILKYLSSIPPFDDKDTSSLLQVFLAMRFNFIQKEISSFSLDTNPSNETLMEIMIKRKIEVLREHTYTSLNIFPTTFTSIKEDVYIPLKKELDINIPIEDNKPNETVATEGATTEGATTESSTTEHAITKNDTAENATTEHATTESDALENATFEDNKGATENSAKKAETDELQSTDEDTSTPIKQGHVKQDTSSNNDAIEESKDQKDLITKENDSKSLYESKKDGKITTEEEKSVIKEKESLVEITMHPKEPKPIEPRRNTLTSTEKKIPTNPFMLQFVNECIGFLLKDLTSAKLDTPLTESVYLQLIYCSFRLRDLNVNYHRLFLNKLGETKLFTTSQIRNAIQKRYELASKYT
ncbi:hypothetical protein TBLA_0E04710 [Henningerozyma blattae CBS 6284]|uniref:Conserved oligomeric Golgi complex subunit 8 n=1 Tax=Henningerozyma blattae (strain ATCC 34711 / CBS 6284 / DSM 70876 / NBRC 10599 / NRRL Y-10934 / UCD 77-7) TaxID=1071380 RepID=I2H571_HENB6|nr:hypothetical protein TBLA_0E04710 [Tetrapisispora blattae CBS 6284]CCH61523.1 hypothetical protein TBLA_0E04710 [Tetrapisispora blattae CBS 6284]